MRVAFGTYLGMPEPETFMGDRDFVGTRRRSDPSAAFGALVDGELVGSNFATRWGSVGFFGPLTVRPDLWDRGVAKALLEPTMRVFEEPGTRHVGLFTFADSERHVHVYQRFGFWPRFLTALMTKRVETQAKRDGSPSSYRELSSSDRESATRACREITETLYKGLDLRSEIEAVAKHDLGDTALLWDGSKLEGFAVCHSGAGTEGGSDTLYVKFAAVRSGDRAAFGRLLDACERLALARNVGTVFAGVNTARHDAYRAMLGHGFRTMAQGIAMHKDNDAGYSRPEVYAIDDWR